MNVCVFESIFHGKTSKNEIETFQLTNLIRFSVLFGPVATATLSFNTFSFQIEMEKNEKFSICSVFSGRKNVTGRIRVVD